MNPERFPIIGVLGVLTVLTLFSPASGQIPDVDSKPSADAESETLTKKSVSLAIDYGNYFEKHYSQIEWREGLSVLGVMEQARAHAHPLRFSFRGKGETAFLKSIDTQKNEGGDGSNWIYYVNRERGDCSFAAKPVAPGDAILWKFES